jgi:hypothetical protein
MSTAPTRPEPAPDDPGEVLAEFPRNGGRSRLCVAWRTAFGRPVLDLRLSGARSAALVAGPGRWRPGRPASGRSP